MSLKLICYFSRKPGMSPAAFRDYYEGNHAPLVIRLIPLMTDYRRSYLRADEAFGASHVEGKTPAPDFDVVTEVWYRNRQEYEETLATLNGTDAGQLLAEDEARFMDRAAMRLYVTEEHCTPLDTISRGRVAAGRDPL